MGAGRAMAQNCGTIASLQSRRMNRSHVRQVWRSLPQQVSCRFLGIPIETFGLKRIRFKPVLFKPNTETARPAQKYFPGLRHGYAKILVTCHCAEHLRIRYLSYRTFLEHPNSIHWLAIRCTGLTQSHTYASCVLIGYSH